MSAWPRWLAAGLGLALLEVALVSLTDRHLFLSPTEHARYALLAALVLPALLLLVGGVGSTLVERLGVRAQLLVTLVGWPLGSWLLWSLTAGRRVRDLPGRALIVMVLAAVAAGLAGWLTARLQARHRRGQGRDGRVLLGAAVLAAAAVALDMYVLRRLYPAYHWSLAGLSLVMAAVAAAFSALPRLPSRPLLAGLVALALWGGSTAALRSVAQAPNVRFAVEQCAPLTGKLLTLWPARAAPSPAAAEVEEAGPSGGAELARAGFLDLRGRDVLLVSVDALRADRLRAYGGHGLTPAIDGLAEESAVFLRAYTPTPHTSYALSSLMTGKLTREVLALSDGAPEHPTLPAMLREHGYRTAAFYPPAIFFVDGDRFEWLRRDHLGFEYVKAMFATAADRVDQLDAYLRAADPQRPLFVWVHLFEPHEPYDPHPRFARGDRPIDRYDGEVATADAAIGPLVERFRAARPGATVILTADHGEEFGEHGGHYHGTTLYDEQLRVPLLWSSPGAVPARALEVPVSTIDITTTLLSALGVPREARMRGADLSGLLAGGEAPEGMRAYGSIGESRMLTDGQLKLICDDGGASCRLFDLRADPEERRDLSAELPDALARLRAELAAMVASVPRVEALALDGASGWPDALARARLGDVTAAAEVVPLLSARRDAVRAAAARAVGELKVSSARNVVSQLCERDPSSEVRAEAAIAALRLGEAAGAQHVRELLAGDGELALRAALALADAGLPDGLSVLLAAARDGELEESQRVAAIEALGRVGGEAEARALLSVLPDVRLRPVVAAALGAIGASTVAPQLLASLEQERYPDARTAQVRALLALGQRSAAVHQLRRFLGTPSSLPGGVALLREAGGLAPGGGELPARGELRQGPWTCSADACQPGAGAKLVLQPKAPGPARAVLRVRVEAGPGKLRLGERTHWLDSGATELALELDDALTVAVSAGEGIWIEALALVPVSEDVPPPLPEPVDGGQPP